MIKQNILFVLPFIPYPLKSGGHQAIFNGIKAVADEYNVFITYDEYEDENSSAEQLELLTAVGCHIEIIPFKKTRKVDEKSFFLRSYIAFWNLKERIKTIFFKREQKQNIFFLQIGLYNVRKILFLNNLIKKCDINIVQCEMLSRISDILILPSNVKKIFIQHEIGYMRQKLELDEKKLTDQYQDTLFQSKQNEIFLLNKFDLVVAFSECDKKIMEKDGVLTPIEVSPAIVNTKIIPLDYGNCKKTLSFVGPSVHEPNFIGINWFVDFCWPTLKRIDPNYILNIIGEWGKAEIKYVKKKCPEAVFYGYIENLKEILSGTIMIVPIMVGSGIRMKILEAIAAGIPVVSTSIGAQGLPLDNGEDCFIADDAKAFVNAIIKLENRDIQKQMVENAQRKIEERYSFSSFKNNRLGVYKKIY